MRRCSPVVALGLGFALAPAGTAQAQGYRLRLDSRVQSVTFRGLVLDSIPVGAVVTGPDGGPMSPDGYSVRCTAGAAYCTFFRPGPGVRVAPVTGTVDVSAWGFGVQGLQLRLTARGVGDLDTGNVWPGTEPRLQLLEGYAEYTRPLVTAQLGRTHEITRLGWVGFDGVRAEVRPWGRNLRFFGYGGFGLARASVLPVTSPEMNPLDDFQPRHRQRIGGGGVGWSIAGLTGRALYQREERSDGNVTISERGALEASYVASPQWTVSGGADYDFAASQWGTADLSVTFTPTEIAQVVAGGRRYRPYFDAWSVWVAFSPAAYSAAFGSATVTPVRGLSLGARGEAYQFDNPAASTPLVDILRDGWRWSLAATLARWDPWTLRATYHADHGPGASSAGIDGEIAFRPLDRLRLSAYGGRLSRPLEVRFDDARLWSYGGSVDYEAADGVRLTAAVTGLSEVRRRPDAAQLDWSQVRFNLGATLVFGSSADTRRLHPAILRIPDARRR